MIRENKIRKLRIVIKIGSNIVTSGNGLDNSKIRQLVKDISDVHSKGHDVIVVSSGAIAAGIKKLGLKKRPQDIRHKQAAAAVGQSILMWAYEKSFSEYGKKVAQVLLTKDVFSDRIKYINAKNTILTLLDYRVIPIINENDTVAIDEIKFGDNDQLAMMVAGVCEADRLIILSDVEGLYTDDPTKNKNACLIKEVTEVTEEIESIAGASTSSYGTGGMYSKVLAAKRATNYGIRVNIISGKKPGLLQMTIDGKKVGTEFIPSGKRISARKGWIAFNLSSKGTIIVDNGAKDALIKKGKSLLPSGIVKVFGNFQQGDAVHCADIMNHKFAKGLVNYSSEEILKIKGIKTSDIEKILGYKYSDEIIHRDNLVILP